MNLCLNHNLLPLLLCTNNKQKQTEWLLQIGEQAMFSCSSTTGTCSLFASIISYIQLQPWLSHYHYAASLGSFIKANGLALATYTQLCSCLQPGHKNRGILHDTTMLLLMNKSRRDLNSKMHCHFMQKLFESQSKQ